MTSETRRKFIFEHPAYRNLVRAAEQIQKAKSVTDVPEAALQMMENAGALVRGSIDVLMERDPLKYELGVIALMLRECMSRKIEKIDGELKMTFEIKDEYLLGWCAEKAFAIPTKFG